MVIQNIFWSLENVNLIKHFKENINRISKIKSCVSSLKLGVYLFIKSMGNPRLSPLHDFYSFNLRGWVV